MEDSGDEKQQELWLSFARMFLGDIMRENGKNILWTVLLGVIFPGIMFSLLGEKPENTTALTIEPTQTISNVQHVGVLLKDGTVETMELDEYITCVVLREMPAEFEIEALKAQAIVARTYTLRRTEIGGKHDNAVVCVDSSCCQGFQTPAEYISGGGTEELLNRVYQAVDQTAGKVILYENQLIDATYFSCSGGTTEDALAVWGTDIPYLQATESPGEEQATYYVDTVTFSASDFLNKLSLNADKQVVIGKITYTTGGGIATIDICGKEFSGTDMRKKLGLRSTAFMISAVGNKVTVTTKGFGHRVGMSQYGAEAMAVDGADCYAILTHYYEGVEIAKYPI